LAGSSNTVAGTLFGAWTVSSLSVLHATSTVAMRAAPTSDALKRSATRLAGLVNLTVVMIPSS
jgi:hypothetical protein